MLAICGKLKDRLKYAYLFTAVIFLLFSFNICNRDSFLNREPQFYQPMGVKCFTFLVCKSNDTFYSFCRENENWCKKCWLVYFYEPRNKKPGRVVLKNSSFEKLSFQCLRVS